MLYAFIYIYVFIYNINFSPSIKFAVQLDQVVLIEFMPTAY